MESIDPADAYSAVAAKRRKVGWDALSERERVLILVSDFFYDVEYDRIPSFYLNPSGDRAVETVWALEKVGASRAAAALQQANALFPGGVPPTHQTERGDEAVRLYNLPDSPLKAIEADYLPHHEGLLDLIDQFVADHEADFRGA